MSLSAGISEVDAPCGEAISKLTGLGGDRISPLTQLPIIARESSSLPGPQDLGKAFPAIL